MEKVKNKTICWFGIYNASYPRNAILLRGLRGLGYNIIECHASATDSKKHWKLIQQLRALRGTYDLIYVAYPSPSVALSARLFGAAPVIVDAFYSMYDAVVNDRREIPSLNPRAWKLALLDWISVIVADAVIADTEAHKQYWASWLFVNSKKFAAVPIGVDEKIFHPTPHTPTDRLLVLFHGSYIALHGALNIVDAAELLKDEPRITFRFVGQGQEYKKIMAAIEAKKLTNIEVIGQKVPQQEIVRHIGESDVVLGIFGDTPKAYRVVPNKMYEALGARKPVITKDTVAIREFFTEEEAVMVKGSGASIAEALLYLLKNPQAREKIAEAGYKKMHNFFPAPLGRMLMGKVERLLEPS